jgi:hypothetical protein
VVPGANIPTAGRENTRAPNEMLTIHLVGKNIATPPFHNIPTEEGGRLEFSIRGCKMSSLFHLRSAHFRARPMEITNTWMNTWGIGETEENPLTPHGWPAKLNYMTIFHTDLAYVAPKMPHESMGHYW